MLEYTVTLIYPAYNKIFKINAKNNRFQEDILINNIMQFALNNAILSGVIIKLKDEIILDFHCEG